MVSKKVSAPFMILLLTVLMLSSVQAHEGSTHSETGAVAAQIDPATSEEVESQRK